MLIYYQLNPFKTSEENLNQNSHFLSNPKILSTNHILVYLGNTYSIAIVNFQVPHPQVHFRPPQDHFQYRHDHASLCLLESSAVITRSNIVRYYMNN